MPALFPVQTFLGVAAALFLGGTISALAQPTPADTTHGPRCTSGSLAPPPPLALRLAALAQREHAAWGGQRIDAHGRLTDAGSQEAEHTRGDAPWQRVLGYWSAVDPTGRLPSQLRFGALRPADRHLLHQSLDSASSARLQGLGVGPDDGLSSTELRALHVALDRVAVVDTPWSAAFISWLAREADIAPDAFTRSEAHADYAAAAWLATQREQAGEATPYALRTCDLARTAPRVGDLVCQTRGAEADVDTFEALGNALARRATAGGALPMHCDVVTQVADSGFDAVGGNVLQSVTVRRLDFAPGTRQLDPSYLMNACTAGTPSCPDRHMSRQPWSLLLQWR